MSINVNFNGANLRKPGAFSRTQINLIGGFPLSATGIVAIIGEAEGGQPGSGAGVQTFTSEDLGALQSIYKSGPIVDAARILISPAKDPRVANGAGLIRLYKTNASLQSSKVFNNGVAAALFTITSSNYGEDENLVSVKIDAGVNPDARIFTISKSDQQEILEENPRDAWMDINYTGADGTCTMTIQSGSLVTATGGTPADDLSIALAGKSVQDLVDLIDASSVYTATTSVKLSKAKQAVDLDPISTATDIKTAAVDMYAAQKELLDIINGQSSLVTVTRVADVEGEPAAIAKTFLTGAAKGASSNTNFQSGFDAFLGFRCNIVVPLISQDASDLASDGETDPASSFTADAINLQAVTHCITASNTKNRSERNCYVSVKRSFALSQDASQDLNSRQSSLITRGVHLDAGNAAMFDRDDSFEGENIFSRYVTVTCLTEFNWDQGEVNLIDCFDTDITATQPGGPDVPLSDD